MIAVCGCFRNRTPCSYSFIVTNSNLRSLPSLLHIGRHTGLLETVTESLCVPICVTLCNNCDVCVCCQRTASASRRQQRSLTGAHEYARQDADSVLSPQPAQWRRRDPALGLAQPALRQSTLRGAARRHSGADQSERERPYDNRVRWHRVGFVTSSSSSPAAAAKC